MNPLLKNCLIVSQRSKGDSTRTAEVGSGSELHDSTASDPYYDDNYIKATTVSDSGRGIDTPNKYAISGLKANIIGSHKDRDPFEIFEPVKMLGKGSMVSK